MACCHDDHCAADEPPNSTRWRQALWIALFINAGFFLAEIIAGVAAGSAALQADALDFFGDATNYAISLGVAGMVLTWRARAALAKGGTLVVFALWVLGSTAWHAVHGTLPRAEVMGVIGFAALIANGPKPNSRVTSRQIDAAKLCVLTLERALAAWM
jgi:Co/Zn/Cd efflux system component